MYAVQILSVDDISVNLASLQNVLLDLLVYDCPVFRIRFKGIIDFFPIVFAKVEIVE